MTHLAYEYTQGKIPTIIWLCGYRSDMNGNKVLALKTWAEAQGVGFFRFDYSGHGQSEGQLENGTISLWLEESLALIREHIQGECILVGSSMGGWIALRAAEELPHNQVKGLVLIAPAPDFTEDLIWQKLTPEQQAHVRQAGRLTKPSEYSDEPNIFTLKLIEDGRAQCLLNRPYTAPCPIHILQGTDDEAVPMAHALTLMTHLGDANAQITLIQGGDHRLSRPEDIEMLIQAVEIMARHVS